MYELKDKVKVDDDNNVNTKQKDPYQGSRKIKFIGGAQRRTA